MSLPFLLLLPSVRREGHAEPAQKRQPVLVRLRRGRDRDCEAANLLDVVVVDLREDDLLPDAERVVTAPVERPRAQAAEVPNARERNRNQSVEKLIHAYAAQRHARADRHPFADLDRRDRLAGPPHLGALAGDDRQLLDRSVELLRVGLRLADTHVERDLLDARNLHRRGQAQLVLEARAEVLLVEALQARRVRRASGFLAYFSYTRGHRSISSPQSGRLQTRTLTCWPCDSLSFIPTRVGLWQTGQTTMTFPTCTGDGFSITPPGVMPAAPIRLVFWIGRGFVCRLTMLRFSTMTLRSFGRASMTRPCLPRSFPLRMWTRSPLRMRMVCAIKEPPVPARRFS